VSSSEWFTWFSSELLSSCDYSSWDYKSSFDYSSFDYSSWDYSSLDYSSWPPYSDYYSSVKESSESSYSSL
jgi:hypothetical protein